MDWSRGGADEAERLVGEHYADVLRYCRRHAPAGLAEDAAQETFLRFVRARARYRERGSARAYLFTIARNVCADSHRRGAMSRETPTMPATSRTRSRSCPGPSERRWSSATARASGWARSPWLWA